MAGGEADGTDGDGDGEGDESRVVAERSRAGPFLSVKEEYLPSRVKMRLKQFLQYKSPEIIATAVKLIVLLHSKHWS